MGTWFNYDAMGQSRNRPVMLLLDGLMGLLFFWKGWRPFPVTPRKLLVIRIDQIGNVVLTTPVFRALHARFPEAAIHVLVRPASVDILKEDPHVHTVHAFEFPWFRKGPSQSWRAAIQFMLALRRERFDLVVDVRPNARNVFAASLLGSYLVASPQSGLRALIHRPFLIPYGANPAPHAIDQNLQCLTVLGISNPSRELELHIAPDAATAIDARLRAAGVREFAVIAPGNLIKAKCWTHDRWARVCDALTARGWHVMVTGSAGDEARFAQPIRAASANRDRVISWCGQTTVGQLVALVGRARLVVSLDTAAQHIAYALDVPSVALFGPMDPEVWGYRTARHRSLLAEGARPRADRRGRVLDQPYAGPIGLSAEQVVQDVEAVLEQQTGGTHH